MEQTATLKKKSKFAKLARYKYLYILMIWPLIQLILFNFVPILGNVIAFRKYQPGASMFGTEWIGFKNFEMFIGDQEFWKIFKNTIGLSVSTLAFIFPLPIIFALLLNEVRAKNFKRIVQTISYLPHFISVVILVGMINEFLSPSTGIVNMIIQKLGGEPIFFTVRPEWFKPIYITTSLWQELGWDSIIYIAALSNIDVGLYEAAEIDGASRFKKVWNITIPGISSTIVTILIINVGHIMSVSFEKVLLLMNGGNQSVAEVISTYTYKMGLVNNNYSYATAVGLFNAVIGIALVTVTNIISKKLSETSLW